MEVIGWQVHGHSVKGRLEQGRDQFRKPQADFGWTILHYFVYLYGTNNTTYILYFTISMQ